MSWRTGPAVAISGCSGRRAFTRCRAGLILKGSPNLRAATQYLYFAGTPAIEARLVGLFGEGGLAKGANDGLPAELAPLSPTAPANLSAAVRVDAGFWHDNLAKLRQRFETWLAH